MVFACVGIGIAALVVITASGGAILTFAPHFLPGSLLGFSGLLAFTGAAAVARLPHPPRSRSRQPDEPHALLSTPRRP